MSEESQHIDVFLDLLPNWPKNDQTRANFRELLRERVEVIGIIRFLKETDLLSDEAATAAEKLGQIRNQYAHARGKNPQRDALKSIKLLHTLVEDTVSVFKEFDIKDGAFVRKARPSVTKS